MKKDGKKKVSAIKNNSYFLKLVWQISPTAVILNFFTTLLGFAQWVFYSVFFLQYLFGAAVIEVYNNAYKEYGEVFRSYRELKELSETCS